MRKLLVSTTSVLLAAVLLVELALAQSPAQTPTPFPTQTPFNSYEAFWPMVAGKTLGDPLYFLKSLKESLRGILVFGSVQKADYSVFLGTKRVLEAEKLLKEGKDNLAIQSLERAIKLFNKASEVKKKSESIPQPGEVRIRSRVENLKLLTDWLLVEKSNEVKSKLKETKSALSRIY